MRIRMKQWWNGLAGSIPPGEYEADDKRLLVPAQYLVENGYAEEIGAAQAEAVEAPVETTEVSEGGEPPSVETTPPVSSEAPESGGELNSTEDEIGRGRRRR